MEKHTPGPWRADQDGDEFSIIGRPTWPCTHHRVRGEWQVAVTDDLGGDQPDEALANARLIAAAPELLAALVEILGPLNVCSDNPNVGDDVCLPIDMTMGELRRARAAIAKATGAA